MPLAQLNPSAHWSGQVPPQLVSLPLQQTPASQLVMGEQSLGVVHVSQEPALQKPLQQSLLLLQLLPLTGQEAFTWRGEAATTATQTAKPTNTLTVPLGLPLMTERYLQEGGLTFKLSAQRWGCRSCCKFGGVG